jgi:hypothetical protein
MSMDIPHNLTARRGGQPREPAQTIKTQILRGVGAVDTTTRIVDRLFHREADLEDGHFRTTAGSGAHIVGEDTVRHQRCHHETMWS